MQKLDLDIAIFCKLLPRVAWKDKIVLNKTPTQPRFSFIPVAKHEMSRSNFAEMKSLVIFCIKVISQDFWCNYPLIKGMNSSWKLVIIYGTFISLESKGIGRCSKLWTFYFFIFLIGNRTCIKKKKNTRKNGRVIHKDFIRNYFNI